MKKVEIKYDQLLFLYAYLRLIDLSLDRSRWTTWNELQSYFENRIRPFQIIQYLKSGFHLPEIDLDFFVCSLNKITITDRLISVVFKRPLMTECGVVYCSKLLRRFEKLLNSCYETYNLEIEKLRIDVAEYYTKVLGAMILSKDLNRLMRIEHFGQNSELHSIKLSEFIPNDFLVDKI